MHIVLAAGKVAKYKDYRPFRFESPVRVVGPLNNSDYDICNACAKGSLVLFTIFDNHSLRKGSGKKTVWLKTILLDS